MGEESDVIRIKFGVAGGDSMDGESAKQIVADLTKIASNINLQVKVSLDESSYKKQLQALKKELAEKPASSAPTATSSVSVEAKNSDDYKKAEKALIKLYNAKAKYIKLSEKEKTDTVSGKTQKKNIEDLEKAYSDLKTKLSADSEEFKQLLSLENSYSDTLNSETKNRDAATYATAEKALNKYYLAKSKVLKLSEEEKNTVAGQEQIQQAETLKKIYEEQAQALKSKFGEESTEVKKLEQSQANLDAKYSEAEKENDKAQAYSKTKQALEELYYAKSKYLKLSDSEKNGTEGEAQLNSIELLSKAYRDQYNELVKKVGAESKEVRQIDTLVGKYNAANTAIEKLRRNAQNMYASGGGGYGEVISRSSEAKKLVDNLNSTIDSVLGSGNPVSKEELKALNAEFLRTETELKRIQIETDTFGNKVKKAFANNVVQMFANAIKTMLLKALKEAINNVVKLDKCITDLQIATGKSRKETEELIKEYASLGKEIGATTTEVANSADTWLRQGYSISEANKLIKDSLMLSKLGQLESEEAAKALTSAMKGYKISVEDATSIVDKFTAVDMKAAISAGDIATAMAETAAGADVAGVSMDRLIGYIATTGEVTQDGAESVGVFFKTLFARMGNVKAGKFVDDETGESLNDVEKILGSLDIKLREDNGLFRDFGDVLDEVGEKWETFDNVQQHAIATAFAGTRQQEKFIVLMENYGDALNYANVAATSSGTAESKFDAAYLDSIEAKVNALTAAWEQFSSTIIESDFIKGTVDALKTLLSVINSVFSFLNGAVGKFIIMGAAFAGITKLIAPLNESFLTFTKNIKALKEASKFGETAINSLKNGLNTFGTFLKKFLKENAPMLIINTLIILLTTLEGKLRGFVSLGIVLVGALTIAILLSIKSINASIKSFMASNPLGWILAAITAVITAIIGMIDLIKAYNPSFEDLKEAAEESRNAWSEVKDELDEVNTTLEELQDRLNELKAIDSPTVSDQAEIERLKQEIELLEKKKDGLEESERLSKADAMNDAFAAADKLLDENEDILKDISNNRDKVLEVVQELDSLITPFEYGSSQKLNNYYDRLFKIYDGLDVAALNPTAVWESVGNRVKYSKAIEEIEAFADGFAKAADITAEEVENLVKSNPEVKKLVDYLKSVGAWDGTYEGLASNIQLFRSALVEIAREDISLGIENVTNKIESLKTALEDIENIGIISLDTLKELEESNPELLAQYFEKTLNGYKLLPEYSGNSQYEILETMAIADLQSYSDALNNAKNELSKYTESDIEYETALKNVAIAQDNLNDKQLEWASALRESAIEDETERLEKLQEDLENQLNVYKELIDIRKDLLESYKEEINKRNELAAKEKSVADLQTQLALAKLDQSAAGQARVRELEQELASAQEELDEYTLDMAVDDLSTLIDDEYSEYEKIIETKSQEIKESIDSIRDRLDEIIKIDSDASNTKNENTAMYDLYKSIKQKQEANSDLKLSDDTQKFMQYVSAGNYTEADKYYSKAQEESSKYESADHELTEDEKIASEMKILTGAWGSGIKSSKTGDNGTVNYNGKEYKIENGGINEGLYNPAVNINKFGDRDIFYYNGEIYGYLDGKIVRIRQRSNSYKASSSEGYEALKRDAKAAGVYHTGGFVGNFTELKSNEEFAKLLKGEFVTTPAQMDRFMKETMPYIFNSTKQEGSIIQQNAPLVEIKCGQVTNEILPKLEELAKKAASIVNKNIEDALNRTGYKKKN